GTISDGGRIAGTVILSDDAGQFNVGDLQALCWIHAERNVGKLDGNTPYQHEQVAPALDRMWKLYRSLAAAGNAPPRCASKSWRHGSTGSSACVPVMPASTGCSKG
ncbi:MAG: hypothetical protein OXC26_00445, partial [Albidovulum sp.]|nr:hypothetical protein [Albidovulum sp.]